MTKTRASSAGGTNFSDRLYFSVGDYAFGTSVSSIANTTFASYLEIEHGGTVQALTCKINLKIDGNIQLGLYNTSWQLVCATAATAVAGLTASTFNWLPTTTNPKIQAGAYYLAMVCDTNYVALTSGVQFLISATVMLNMFDTVTDYGVQQTVSMAAAYPLPAVFVPANYSNAVLFPVAVRMS